MSLGLLAPLALALGLVALGPVLAHLAQQRPSQRQAFGAMLLLRRLVRRLEKRRRLKDRWLLALRALALLALVLAVARPELRWPEATPALGGRGAVVVALDDSLSMALVDRGTSLLARARQAAVAQIEALPPGTRLGLTRCGGEGEAATPALTTDHAAVIALIEGSEAGFGRTDLAGCLNRARALLAGAPGEVLVYTDEAGPGVVTDAAEELRALIEQGAVVLPRPVSADPPRNVALVDAVYGDGPEGGVVAVRVANFGPEPVELPATLSLPDGSEITAFLELEPGEEDEETFTVPQTVPGGVAALRLQDPALPADDLRSFHLPRVGASRVMVIDGDPGSTPSRSEVYFLERALAPWGGRRGGVLPEVRSPAGLAELDPTRHQVVFLANVSDLSGHGGRLTDFVRAGGGLVLSMGNNVTAERTNGPLRDLLPAPLDRPRDLVDFNAARGAAMSLPDVSLPLFKPFSAAGRRGFAALRARRVMALAPYEETGWDDDGEGVRTLLRYEGGVPALVERRVGRGRVLLWTSTFDVGWTDAPLQAAFMPLIQRMVGLLGGEAGGGAERVSALVGEPVLVRLPVPDLQVSVTGPDGQPVSADLVPGASLEVRFTPETPGAYQVGLPGEPPMALVAVNTPPEESDVRVTDRLAAVEAGIDPALFQRRLALGPAALWLGLLALVGQAFAAGGGAKGSEHASP